MSSDNISTSKTSDTSQDEPQPNAPEMPKIELKMVLPLIIMMFQNKIIDLKVPDNVDKLRMAMITSVVAVYSVYFILYMIIKNRKNSTEIWVPPKPTPAMPFSPPPPKPTHDKYEKTTYSNYECGQIIEIARTSGTSIAIALFMSYKFNIHISCLFQLILVPFSLYDNLVCRKNLGLTSGVVYGELLELPPVEIPKKKEKNYVKPPPLPEKKNDENMNNIDE
jgi:hypothetical protein